jgi:hypothetical protein
MKIDIKFNKDDILQYLLYNATKEKSIKKKYIRNRIISTLLEIIYGIIIYLILYNNIFILIGFGILSVITFLLYPIYYKSLYKRYYVKIINEKIDNDDIDQTATLEIDNGFILSKNDKNKNEGKLDINVIKEIIELNSYFYIYKNKVMWTILPKNNETNLFVNKLVNEYNIKIKDEKNWKWKL